MDHAVPAFVRLAAHPLRWRLLRELAGGDHRVRELVDAVGEPQNLVSYHLRLLRDAGLVTARRSSFDARDSYHHLDLERCAHALTAAGTALHPALGPAPAPATSGFRPAVLFACTGNSARSPIAEALLDHRTGGRVEAASAGSHPKQRLHPDAVQVLRDRYGIDVADRRPRPLSALAGRRFDYVISLCDKVREVCPDFGDQARRVHWSLPDPAAEGGADRAAFVQTAADIDTRIRYLLPRLVHPSREVSP
ncbi:ArsR family transcriptional regulator [Actinomadura sp. KC06]|uniref:arsenate reductase/protein-tyrosine-phosphatase family protein n=1 Tax=Actinomadura sp. KC06 TaxID=2530369 RepID=UPI00104FB314|nr:ArsR family transcriptional regulator [Actinomadura sp. KC06]TDD32281.1 ArsR family transcriptional regulator [Actinomadura sp. KC06]